MCTTFRPLLTFGIWTLLIAFIMSGVALAADTATLEDRVSALEKKNLEKNRISDIIAIHGVLGATYQVEDANSAANPETLGRGRLAFEPEFIITPAERDEIFFKFGFPVANGLNGETNFIIPPWAANAEDDVKNINGRNRDYLLQAWYKHTFEITADNSLGITGGIIDATAYLDQNGYANDEYTQFMNPALVNGPNGFAPSFDLGGAVEWEVSNFYLNVVVMDIGQNEDGYNTTFYGGEFGYKVKFGFGEGTYRIIYEGADESFPSADPASTKLEDRNLAFLSIDQELGKNWGAWIRFGWGTNDALVSATNLYSGGIDIKGGMWGRGQDNIGIGYAYFDGGNDGTKSAAVGEAYYRWLMNDLFALTFDVQYQENKYETPADGTDVDGFTYGLRGVVEF